MSTPYKSSSSNRSSLDTLYFIIHNLDREAKTIVSFGKYKNQTFDKVASDLSYCRWLCKQQPTTIDMLLLKQFIEKIEFIRNKK